MNGAVTGVTRELAQLPEVVQRLLVLHVPDENRRCRACTQPGTGTPRAPWPCALHFYASAAQEIGCSRGIEWGSR